MKEEGKMTVSRRGFLKGVGAVSLVAAMPVMTGCGDGDGDSYAVFEHGVASGDPTPGGAIIWTRVTTRAEYHAGGKPAGEFDEGPVDVRWEVSQTRNFATIDASGETIAEPARDYTVKVDVDGLEAGTTYYYRFSVDGQTSDTGRFRTIPEGDVDRLRFAVASCASGAHGYFNAYRHMADEDLDAVLFLGDYIYEYANKGFGTSYGTARLYDPPHEIVSLEDYRRRYSWYRKNIELQQAHQQHAFICIWDDHEVADNSWPGGANNHQPDKEGNYADRLAAAHQAYFEWMPIREMPNDRIWRSFHYGNLVDLLMLDTRMWGRTFEGEDNNSPDKDLLGADQEAWMNENLQESTTKWRILGQQVMVGQLNLVSLDKYDPVTSFVGNADQWDGYKAARERLYESIRQTPGGNVVILTGDIHTAFVSDVTPNIVEGYNAETGEGSLAVEFVCTSITSPSLEFVDKFPKLKAKIREMNPHYRHANFVNKGYTVLDITDERVHADYMAVSTIEVPVSTIALDASFYVEDGKPFAREADGLAPPRSNRPEKA